jgi:hypothetical protein
MHGSVADLTTNGKKDKAATAMNDDDLHHGIKFVHDLAMAALARAERAEVRISTLLEALTERGVLDAADGPEMSPAPTVSPLQQYQPAILVSTSAAPDKHTVPSPDVDCTALIPLCHARCCRMFRVILSYQDVEDGLRWVYERPYELRREADGYCTHFDRETPGCGTYQTRPAPCRTFDCRDNPNIWLDFDRRIPVPMDEPLFQIRRRTRSA